MLLRGPALPASASAVGRVLHEAGYELEEVATRPHPDTPADGCRCGRRAAGPSVRPGLADRTALSLLHPWRVEPLFNPPRRPAYNGGLERTHPILKSYMLAAAAALISSAASCVVE